MGIVKREQAGSGTNIITENETMSKFEIMDGAPVRGESIPVRLFLASFPLVPTQRDVCNKFSSGFISTSYWLAKKGGVISSSKRSRSGGRLWMKNDLLYKFCLCVVISPIERKQSHRR